MNNPIKLFNEIFDAYLKYINSGLPFFRDEYNQERDALIKEGGTISQPPIIEIVPKYHEKATLQDFCKNEGVSEELNDFVNTGLFTNNAQQKRRLYDHQYAALKSAHIDRKHIVVTTGTGSGKTECFLLPVFADLVKESASWSKDRSRAMRTMILYPLNALAEDQMIRLRKALNCHRDDNTGSLDWLDAHRNGHRFYFGRYTGSTPVSGTKDKAKSKLLEEKRQHIADWNAAKDAALETGNKELLFHVPCMENDSAEMWDRFSMQDNAPDILITNYSMLNVMLMRKQESKIFDDTRKWLAEDPSHVFHLVVDELHTYRGTSGTEVAYLLRVLLDRLGLEPNSKQVQFLATSASLEQNQQSIDFLAEFFGIDKAAFKDRFTILSNPPQPSVDKPTVSIPESALVDYIENTDSENAETTLFGTLKCSSYKEVSEKYVLLEWLKYALSTPKGIIAKDVNKIAQSLDINKDTALEVVASLIKIICQSSDGKNFIAPLRAHFFFRNVSGLWGCSNPECSCVKPEYAFEGRTIGKFYKRPRNVCDCGMKVLEVLVCENCGETYLGGYKITNGNKTFLSPEKPISESFVSYCILWKGEADSKDGWKKVTFNTATGEFYPDMNGEYWLYEQSSDAESKYPHKCPKCEVAYVVKDKNSITPIRHHGTGLQKINQILADSLIRSMKKEKETNTKVVLFSDSRQSAAKLSAGIELDHFRDVLRWSILHALNGNNETVEFLRKARATKNLTKEDGIKLRHLTEDHTYEGIAKLIMAEKMDFCTDEDILKLDTYFKNSSGLKLDNIEDDVFKILLSLGMNPAGPKPSVTINTMAGLWSDLFDFDQQKVRDDLSDNKREFSDRIRRSNKIEQLASVFSNRNRSFEELKLGYLCPSISITDPTMLELACSAVRILGEKKRVKEMPSKYPPTASFPMAVRRLIKHVYHYTTKADVDAKVDELRDLLRQGGIIDKSVTVLTGEGLSFIKSEVGSKYWVCPRCKTIHMHHSNGLCINCFHKLEEPSILTEEDILNPNDYYLTLLSSTENVYRLHCEEMTGQTSKTDSKKRQRLFQDIFLKTENPKVDGIDLLSVTTTMEAGVDIGSLSAVMMGNVPPQRFNYQQRVGRAGRRGNPLSIALTVARSSSHDITNFHEYERMVSDTPKDPYLEVRTQEIAERIIYKEILYLALKNYSGSNESVHGNFGTIDNWENNKLIVRDWLENNQTEVKRVITYVTRGTELTNDQKEAIYNYIYSELLDKISTITTSDEYTQEYLSERLANAGILPMFGFPTRTRNLYLSMPTKLPAEDVVTRDIDMALNSFAPGHEIVKDKKVYKAVGIVDYEYNKNTHLIQPKFNSLNKYKQPLTRCKSCGYSTITNNEESISCPVCGNEMETAKICSPLGFCVDYSMPAEDFNGSYDWYSPNSDIKLDCENSLTECPRVNNLVIRNNIIPSQGLVHLVNDNNGDFYKLGLNNKGIYVSRSAYDEEYGKSLKLEYESKYAFISSKSTGVLALSIADTADNICLSPLLGDNVNSYAVRATFLSWGYLVRKAISNYLDIDSSEFNVGFYISPLTQKAEVFFVEQLENGAGYCNYLSGRRYSNVPLNAIVQPLLEGGNIYEQLMSHDHKHGCTSSCYDCIRDYSNQAVHGLLDWRLGLDLARLANSSSAKVDFTLDYWDDYIFVVVKNMLTTQGYVVERREDTLYGTDPLGDKFCVIHPLWSESYINGLVKKLDPSCKRLSVFDISTSNVL